MKLNLLPKSPLYLAGLVLFVILLLTLFLWPKKHTQFETAPIVIGAIRTAVEASGTLQPIEVIDIGAQVAGKLNSFGLDESGKSIDFGSQIKKGSVLAKIDDSLYSADLAQAQAELSRSNATLSQEQARLTQASLDWQRAQKVGIGAALSQTIYYGYKSTYDVEVAAVEIARAQIALATAALERAQKNVDYCTITSPVDGIVIDRRVNIGQTVVSSLNAPSLFLIASDLKKIQIWVPVNEADIGRITPGQTVTFKVPTFPNETFKGSVGKIRLNASMTQNVVTYTVEVNTENPGARLLPYLTADVSFQTASKDAVMLVPNTALRFSPEKSKKGINDGPTIWIDDNGTPTKVPVTIGITDGVNTEVSAPG